MPTIYEAAKAQFVEARGDLQSIEVSKANGYPFDWMVGEPPDLAPARVHYYAKPDVEDTIRILHWLDITQDAARWEVVIEVFHRCMLNADGSRMFTQLDKEEINHKYDFEMISQIVKNTRIVQTVMGEPAAVEEPDEKKNYTEIARVS